jgi:hypothetical protein
MKWIFRGSLVVIILFWSCIGSFALNFVFRLFQNNDCSVSSPVYQSIKANANGWISQFGNSSGEFFRNDPFLILENRNYYAEVYRDIPNSKPALVYVIVGTDRAGLYGSEGFLYLFPDQVIPDSWFNNYWITYLDDNIYCYRIRGF